MGGSGLAAGLVPVPSFVTATAAARHTAEDDLGMKNADGERRVVGTAAVKLARRGGGPAGSAHQPRFLS